jgi:vancomycin resistance protein YoaR
MVMRKTSRDAGRDRPSLLDEWGEDVRRNRRRRGGMGFVGVILAACALLAVIVAADYWVNQDKIYRGVTVGNVDVGGLSPVEAERLIQERSARQLEEITFKGPGDDLTLTAEQLGIEFDVAGTVDAAYSVGRSGGLGDRISERFNAAVGTVRVTPDVSYDATVARSTVEGLARELDRQPRDASVSIAGGAVEMQRAQNGYELDQEATLANVQRAVDNMGGEVEIVGEELQPTVTTATAQEAEAQLSRALESPLVLSASEQGAEWAFEPAQVAQMIQIRTEGPEISVSLNRDAFRSVAADVYATLNVEARNADYEINGNSVEVIPSQTGLRLQEGRLFSELSEKIFQGQHNYELPVQVSRPEFTTRQAHQMKPTNKLGEYDTNYLSYDDDPGRVTNLKIASGAVNNTLLAPGEVFSFNALAAPLDYEEAKVIVDGRVDTADGGGLCQVSSTLYMAANYAGLEIVERHPHHAELPYIRPGFDATVWFGSLDMQFRNSTDGYLLIKQWVNENTGDVVSQIWGKPNGTEVQMRSEKIFDGTDAEGNPMTQWVTYKTVERNGQIIFDGEFHTDTYKYLKPAESSEPTNTTSNQPPSA